MSTNVIPFQPSAPNIFNPVRQQEPHNSRASDDALVGERLSLTAFQQLSGSMGGYPFVKVVVERQAATKEALVHFINNERYQFHADYIAERIKGIPSDQLRAEIDSFNKLVYLSPERPYILGILALHQIGKSEGGGAFFTLESVEIDNMDAELLLEFAMSVQRYLDPSVPLYFKPANHLQEANVMTIDPAILPRIFNHELFASRDYVPLNTGKAEGRLRIFTDETYKRDIYTIKWYDIIVMDRVPDSIPRVSGLINSQHTTPLSHTNVLACGWGIPNAVQLGALGRAAAAGLDGSWVKYSVDAKSDGIQLEAAQAPQAMPDKPKWSTLQIRLEEPETINTPILPLEALRMSDRFRYGTKAANLGELKHVLEHGSSRLTGFYRVPRPPRAHLLSHLADYLGVPNDKTLSERAWRFLRGAVEVPRGIAIPFSVQQEFLQSSWKIQQLIGKLKMALELSAKEVDPVCIQIQQSIRATRISDELRDRIDEQIANHLGGVRSFVVRSSSNAEDLKDFSAAGIYESINHVTTADKIFDSIKEVWASLLSPRSVRLRQDVGISLDDCYMGVIIQEEVQSDMGGVLVTTNPTNPSADFRNVYVNASDKSAVEIVTGQVLAHQYLYNTVEGGGRTIALGSSGKDLDARKKAVLQRLAFSGRLLQSHFSQDYTFSAPADIEWAANGETIYVLQLRPYAI